MKPTKWRQEKAEDGKIRTARLPRKPLLISALGRFLLHYVSRDAIDLLKSGIGGFIEAREAVEQYEEKSPLYGLVHYRRKKVLLKYLPEGTSRLLQGISARYDEIDPC